MNRNQIAALTIISLLAGVAIHRRQQQHGDGEKEPEPRQPVALASSVWLVEHVSRVAFQPFQKKLKSF